MAYGFEVLEMLIPEGGWSISGDDFEGIVFESCKPITKKQFQDGFDKVDAWKQSKLAEQESARKAICDKLGITVDEARLILS